MQLRDGSNTISDERFERAVRYMAERHWDENGSERSEEMPFEIAARHAREAQQLDKDRMYLGVQEWLRYHPDQPPTAREIFTREIFTDAARQTTSEYTPLERHDILNTYNAGLTPRDPIEVPTAQLDHTTNLRQHRGVWAKLVGNDTHDRVDDTFLAHRHQAERFRVATGVKEMADTPRQQMDRWWNQQKIAVGLAAPVQGQLPLLSPTETQRQQSTQQNVVKLSERPRPTLVQ